MLMQTSYVWLVAMAMIGRRSPRVLTARTASASMLVASARRITTTVGMASPSAT